MYKESIVAHQRRKHLTEKPVPLLEAMLDVLPADATVLDPFMGSGTTGAACLATGRKFIGIEMDGHYYEVACERLRDQQPG